MTYRRKTADFWSKCYDSGPDEFNKNRPSQSSTLCEEINEQTFEFFIANGREPKRLYVSLPVHEKLGEELKKPENKILIYSLEIKILKRTDSILIIE